MNKSPLFVSSQLEETLYIPYIEDLTDPSSFLNPTQNLNSSQGIDIDILELSNASFQWAYMDNTREVSSTREVTAPPPTLTLFL